VCIYDALPVCALVCADINLQLCTRLISIFSVICASCIDRLILDKDINIEKPNAYGDTALHIAIVVGQRATIKYALCSFLFALLVCVYSCVYIALTCICSIVHFIGRLIMEKGGNVKDRNKDGDTALHYAAILADISHDHLDTVRQVFLGYHMLDIINLFSSCCTHTRYGGPQTAVG
jgi:ankyrin repeat protein